MDAGYSPIRSGVILGRLVRQLLRRFPPLVPRADEVAHLVKALEPYLPAGYFPDTYVDVEIGGDGALVLAFRLDSRECNLVIHRTGGSYFAWASS